MSIALSLAPGVHATLTLAEQEAALREVRETLTAEGGEGGAKIRKQINEVSAKQRNTHKPP